MSNDVLAVIFLIGLPLLLLALYKTFSFVSGVLHE
jgi:hypothetical protein